MLKLPDKKPEIKIGQKVKLANLTLEEANILDDMAYKAGWGFQIIAVTGMEKYFGTEVTVKKINSISFNIKEGDFNWNVAWIEQNSLVSSRSNGNSKCLICGSTGYAGFFSFECDNNDCQNRRK